MSFRSSRPLWTAIGVIAVLALGGGSVLVASAATTPPSAFVSIEPTRVLDTRDPSSPITTLGENATATLSFTGKVPLGANAVTLNVTAVDGTQTSYLTLYPTGGSQPGASSVNWGDNQAYPNGVTVQLGTTQSINVFNAFGTVNVLIDLNGYYGAGGSPPTPAMSAGNWGVMNRNTIGSPVAELRSGPFTPPVGTGSLNLGVGSPTEKAAYGNEVDFFNTPFAVTAVGFYVYNLGENITPGQPTNMPSIALEILPKLAAFPASFSTLVYFPETTAPGVWSNFIDGTTEGLWGLTGTEFDGVPCGANNVRCSWADMQAFLNDGGDPPTLLSVAVTKGRDVEWHGAVDGLRINNTIYNFEENGVVATTA